MTLPSVSIAVLADQVEQAAQTPTQQAPAQADAMAERLYTLSRSVRQLDLRTGLRLERLADGLRGRAVSVPWRPYSPAELTEMARFLRHYANILAGCEQEQPSPPPSSANVLSLPARRRPIEGGDAA